MWYIYIKIVKIQERLKLHGNCRGAHCASATTTTIFYTDGQWPSLQFPWKSIKNMGLLELFLIAVGLSMDAFAVAACIGLNAKPGWGRALTVGLYFGAAQSVMPVIGWLAGASFAEHIAGFSAYIAFAVLAFIGGKMIKESFAMPAGNKIDGLNHKKMLAFAAATSIDALAVGITFAFLSVNILAAAGLIGAVTFILSAAGVKIGAALGVKLKSKAEFAGGLILIIIGAKILLEQIFG